MRAYVAVTDQDWFDLLYRHPDLDEVNFWTPNPWGGEFHVAEKGELLLFKLKSPYDAIAGGGFLSIPECVIEQIRATHRRPRGPRGSKQGKVFCW